MKPVSILLCLWSHTVINLILKAVCDVVLTVIIIERYALHAETEYQRWSSQHLLLMSGSAVS